MNKPVRNEETSSTEPTHLSRRNFLKYGLGTLAGVAVLESGIIGWMFIQSRAKENESVGIVKAGNLEDFQPGSITSFEKEGFYLLCTEDRELLAISSRCPHLGCSVSWQPETKRFICPCHASSFDQFGNFESPPVPRPLDIYEISFEDSNVLVNKTRIITREKFESTQLTTLETRKVEEINE